MNLTKRRVEEILHAANRINCLPIILELCEDWLEFYEERRLYTNENS
jgi:hypothetical protein